MQLIEDIGRITTPFQQAAVTIGNFDGVHIGHQTLFDAVKKKASLLGGTSVALTFEPHPMRVLQQNNHPPLITLYEQKIELIEKTGMDVLICIPFDRQFASMSAEAFIESFLVNQIGMKAMIVGRDYTFGKNRQGDLDLLKSFSARLDFEVIVCDWVETADKQRVSSTRIRELVGSGQVEEAGRMLGRFYQIKGTVSTGRDRGGKLLGFPTANIRLYDELCPKMGVYAVTAEVNDTVRQGVANIGVSPTFDDNIFTVEVHILDFNNNIYDQTLRVNFVRRIRDEQKFDSVSLLSEQIKKDIQKARDLLS